MNKKENIIIPIISLFSIFILPASIGQKNSAGLSDKDSFPDSISCTVKPYYRHRSDGKAGREIILNFRGSLKKGG